MDIYSEILRPRKKEQKENKICFRNLLTWNKGSGQGQNSEEFRMYPIADEKCLFVMKGQQGYVANKDDYWEGFEPLRGYFENERKKSGLTTAQLSKIDSTRVTHYWAKSQWEMPNATNYNKIRDYCIANGIDAFRAEYDKVRAEYDKVRAEWYETRAYFDNTHDNMNNVWHFDRTGNKERELTGGHATPKPIALCSRAIKSSSREGEIVLDVFGGSGSTLIACEQLNRICYMMELDPKYCDVIIKRYENLTGKKAVKIN